MLPNQVPLPDAQVKRRAAKVWSRDGVYPRGSPARSWEHKSQSCLPKGRGWGWSYLSDKAEAAARGERRLGIRERRDNCSAQAQLSYTLPHQPQVSVFSERGVLALWRQEVTERTLTHVQLQGRWSQSFLTVSSSELDTADCSWKTALPNILLFRLLEAWRTCKIFVSTIKASLIMRQVTDVMDLMIYPQFEETQRLYNWYAQRYKKIK